jgi:glycosyltransferase involved in cell wall biosynthesis
MSADPVGGVWTYALDLARALPSVEFAVATMGQPLSPPQRTEVHGLPNVQLFESTHRLEWMQEPWADVAEAGRWLLDLQSRLRPDIVHLNGYAHARLPWRAPVLVVAHSCVLSWWQAVKGRAAPPEWDRYREEVRRGIGAADLVVAPTHAMLASLQANYGAVRNACVIPNGRAATQFRPGLKSNLILAAGRLWDEAKNTAMLEQVAPRLRWPVYLAGDSDGAVESDNVRRLGRLAPAELALWYGRATIYALPALYEPFGLSVLEAALSGCVLVLGDLPSLRENWRDAAIFVPPGDAAAIEHALNDLIDDAHRRPSLRARARARASRLTPERMASAYLESYRSLIAGYATERICA